MSWNVSIIGQPEAVVAELDRESERQSGQCKVEFDSAKPHLVGLVKENFSKNASSQPLIVHLEASGSGYESGGTQVSRSCLVSLKSLYARLAT